MKTLIYFLVALFLVGYVADAQIVVYKDSLNANKITSAGKISAGFGEYRYSSGRTPKLEPVFYRERKLMLSFAYIMDSVKIQAAQITQSATSSTDTVWHDLLVPVTQAGINTGAGVAVQRDTLTYWITPGMNAAWSTKFLVDLSKYNSYPLLRFVNGKLDSLVRFSYIKAR